MNNYKIKQFFIILIIPGRFSPNILKMPISEHIAKKRPESILVFRHAIKS
jgi:hypothetical protein